MFPSSVDFITVDGRMVGIPGENMVTGLLYNRIVLGEAGIADPPTTVQELERSGDGYPHLGRRDRRRPGLIESGGGRSPTRPWRCKTGEGGRAYDESGGSALGGLPCAVTIGCAGEWLQPGGFPRGSNSELPKGRVAMGIGLSVVARRHQERVRGRLSPQDSNVTLMPMGSTFGSVQVRARVRRQPPQQAHRRRSQAARMASLNVIDDITPISHMMASLGSLPNVPSDTPIDYELDRPFYEGFILNLRPRPQHTGLGTNQHRRARAQVSRANSHPGGHRTGHHQRPGGVGPQSVVGRRNANRNSLSGR